MLREADIENVGYNLYYMNEKCVRIFFNKRIVRIHKIDILHLT